MPVHNSGCRYFGRLTQVLSRTPCYLRTYTYLLEQHKKMLGIAAELEQTGSWNISSSNQADKADGVTGMNCAEQGVAHVAALERWWADHITVALSKATSGSAHDAKALAVGSN